MNIQLLKFNTSVISNPLLKKFELTESEANWAIVSAYHAIREVVNDKVNSRDIVDINILINGENSPAHDEMVNNISEECTRRLTDRIDLPLLMTDKIARVTVISLLEYIRKQFVCNSMNTLIRFFEIVDHRLQKELTFENDPEWNTQSMN